MMFLHAAVQMRDANQNSTVYIHNDNTASYLILFAQLLEWLQCHFTAVVHVQFCMWEINLLNLESLECTPKYQRFQALPPEVRAIFGATRKSLYMASPNSLHDQAFTSATAFGAALLALELEEPSVSITQKASFFNLTASLTIWCPKVSAMTGTNCLQSFSLTLPSNLEGSPGFHR